MIGVNETQLVEDIIGPGGLLVFLIVVVVFGGFKKWWVAGWVYDDVRSERDMYRQLALRATKTAETAVKNDKGVVPDEG